MDIGMNLDLSNMSHSIVRIRALLGGGAAAESIVVIFFIMAAEDGSGERSSGSFAWRSRHAGETIGYGGGGSVTLTHLRTLTTPMGNRL